MDENIEFALSFDSIKNIRFDKYEKNFNFVVDGKDFPISRIAADLLSPIIYKRHFNDETNNKFYININNKDLKAANDFDFADFLSLISFEPKKIKIDQLKYFIDIFYFLGNTKAILQIIPQDKSEITTDNVFKRIQTKLNFVLKDHPNFNDNNENKSTSCFILSDEELTELFQKEIEFISAHFTEFQKEEITNLNPFLLEKVIYNDKLRLEDEDSLIELINEMYSKSHHYSFLYEHVDFFNVSEEKFQEFFTIFDLNDINYRIWENVIKRGRNHKSKSSPKVNGLQFKFEKGQEFNGIIKYLTDKAGGNLHEKGIVEMTSSSTCKSDVNLPKNLLDFNQNKNFAASPTDSWVCYDFKNRRIKISNYSIKSEKYDQNGHHLKCWDIEISNNGNNWTKIDQHKDDPTLNGKSITGSFEVQPNDFSRYVRLHQTGKPWGGDTLWFSYIEFHGYLQE